MNLAILTPAYSVDLALLEMSAESVDRHCPPDVKHYVIVSRQEYHLFRHLESRRRSIVVIEDVVPRWAFRSPILFRQREVWVVDWHRLVRGWIMQQAIKLCGPEITDADIFLFLDADVFFIRPFTVNRFVHDGRVRLFSNPGMGRLKTHMRWHRAASKLLGLPSRDYYGADFIGGVITWRRDSCLDMRARIALSGGADWFSTVVRQRHLSEYILYGIFVNQLPGQLARHFATSEELCLSSWGFMEPGKDPMRLLAARLRPHHVAINIQSNLGLPTDDYRTIVDAAVAIAEAASH